MTGGQHYEPCVLNGDGECHRWNHAHPKPRCVDGWCGPWRDGVCVDCGNLRNYTPTPVPSEVAETTAGEREVEALARAEVLLGQWQRGEIPVDVLLSHLAALLDRVRREEGAKVLREAAERLPALTEGADRAGTATWRPNDRDVYSLAIEEAQAALLARAASVGPTD